MPHDGFIMSRPVSKLIDLDIDEVSVVDRGANQHSLIAFSKSLQPGGGSTEDSMPDDVLVYDEAGQEVSVGDLEHGETVFDAEGNEYVFVEDGAEELDLETVGKARFGNLRDALNASKKGFAREMGRGPGGTGARTASKNPLKASVRGARSGFGAAPGATLAAAGGAGAVGGAGYGLYRRETSKSLGDSVIEELSKAVTDADRDEIIAKALNEVEVYKAQAEEALAWAEQEHDARVTEAFVSKAAEYNLPVSPEVLGPILKSVAAVLTEEELDILDEIFNAVGDALYEELGYVGESSNNSVLDQVDAMANEYVGKSSDFSHAQMTTALFEANPAAYDAYLAEMGR